MCVRGRESRWVWVLGLYFIPPELRYAGQWREFEKLWRILMSRWRKGDTVILFVSLRALKAIANMNCKN